MNTHEINSLLHELSGLYDQLEDAFIDGGGEVTEQTVSYEDAIEDVKDLLLGEGVDSLGRWLKAKEDQKAALKDEKAKIERMIKANDRTIDHIKSTIDTVLEACGMEGVKGTLYSFKRMTSTTHTANTELIEERYAEKVEAAAHIAGLPVWLRVKVSPSWSLVPDGVETDEFTTTVTPTVRFNKPRKVKDNE